MYNAKKPVIYWLFCIIEAFFCKSKIKQGKNVWFASPVWLKDFCVITVLLKTGAFVLNLTIDRALLFFDLCFLAALT